MMFKQAPFDERVIMVASQFKITLLNELNNMIVVLLMNRCDAPRPRVVGRLYRPPIRY